MIPLLDAAQEKIRTFVFKKLSGHVWWLWQVFLFGQREAFPASPIPARESSGIIENQPKG